ncbi:MAG: 3-hydroxyacyl-CoA dehydrogenase [Solibacterales bacterium]|nr:3-hydroxyacyl-CoA dehydrogenase [Bryobacterales bacterium]|tara:strand:- start:89318 stop:91456 length:2139 start_codon:yes stop_codon:yes gene_type:complete
MSNLVGFTRNGSIGVITIHNPPVNALSPGVPEGIAAAVLDNQDNEEIEAFVLIGEGRTFIAGADIREFDKITSGKSREDKGLHPVLNILESSSKPIVAAIHGTAFGGGLEVAQACHYRVALRSSQVGQPEVKLGIIPGAAGTQRLPRLAGVEKAAEMCAFGNPVGATEALECDIVDKIVDGVTQEELQVNAVAFAHQVAASGGPHPRASEKIDKLGDEAANSKIFSALRMQVRKKCHGYMAPLKNIDAVEAATKLPFKEGLVREAEIFEECLFSDQSKALIHAFFGEREVRKIPDVPRDTPTIEIQNAGVIGAGTMGSGIAMTYVNAGIPVRLCEVNQERLDQGMAAIRKNYQRSINRGRFTQEYVESRLRLIKPQLSYAGFEEVDIIVEAVFESMALKKEIFGEIDRVAKPHAILASNTSTLSIDEIASVTSRPASVIGNHFFSPANVMRLLEIVRGEQTSKETIASCMALARRLRKVGVLVGNCFGFVGNRMFHSYTREAQFLAEEGTPVSLIDKTLYDFGWAMGPFAVLDLAGLDVGYRIRKELPPGLLPKEGRQAYLSDRLYGLGRYGQKTGSGYYKYDENLKQLEDTEVVNLAAAIAAEYGIEQHTATQEEIIDRTLLTLANSGSQILEENVALRPVDIDMIYLNGYGFPAFRGGPMWYADSIGLDKVYERILEFEKRDPIWWKPSALLSQLATQGKTFSQWSKERG